MIFAFSFAFGIVAIVQFTQSGYLIERDLIVFIASIIVGIVFLRIRYKKETDQKILKDDDINLY